MKKSEFNTGDKVVATVNLERPRRMAVTPEQYEKGERNTFFIESSSHITTIVNKKYVTISHVTRDNEDKDETVEIMFDGWAYFCDDGSAYYPNFNENGKLCQLRLANDEDIQTY